MFLFYQVPAQKCDPVQRVRDPRDQVGRGVALGGGQEIRGALPGRPEVSTGISSQIRTKLRDWANRLAEAGCYSQAAMSSNDSKTL